MVWNLSHAHSDHMHIVHSVPGERSELGLRFPEVPHEEGRRDRCRDGRGARKHAHTRLLEEPNYQRLSNITELAHFFGPANIFSDAISRGYHLLVSELSAQLRIEIEWIPTDLKVLTVLQELR